MSENTEISAEVEKQKKKETKVKKAKSFKKEK